MSDNRSRNMNTIIVEAETLRETSAAIQYKRILVPHDGSMMADNALKHAIYLANMSKAEIIILNVLEHLDNVDSSAVVATNRGQSEVKETKSNYEITLEGEVKNMVEEKIRLCKEAGLKGQVSYKIQTGKPAEEIIKVSEEMNIDLLVMASNKSSSLVSRIVGSTVRRVIDDVENPVLIVGSKRSKNNEKEYDSANQYETIEPPPNTKEQELTSVKEP
jgi:nucleotide-binding universal stress UspA family protein